MRDDSYLTPGPPPQLAPTEPALASPPAPRPYRRNWLGIFATACVATMLGTGIFAAVQHPTFYTERLQGIEQPEQANLSKQFLNKGTRLLNDIQNQHVWMANFDEEQINAWLAEDFEMNHAEQSLPSGTSKPRISLEGDLMRLGFTYAKGPCTVVIQIGFRAWVPKRNMLAVEIDGAKAGWLPLPTSYTRSVIEQFADANSLEVTWKRNGGRLVALFNLPKGHRELVLHKVLIQTGSIEVKGGSVRLPIPAIDYAPSAN